MLNTFRVVFVDYDGNEVNPNPEGCGYVQTGSDVYYSFDWGNPDEVSTPRDVSGTGIADQYAYDTRTLNDLFRKYPNVPFPTETPVAPDNAQMMNPPGENPLPYKGGVDKGRTGELATENGYITLRYGCDGASLDPGPTPPDERKLHLWDGTPYSRYRGVTTDLRTPSYFFGAGGSNTDVVENTENTIVDYANDPLVDNTGYNVEITQTPTASGTQPNEIDTSNETDFPQWIYIGVVGAGGPGGAKIAGIANDDSGGGDCPNPPCAGTNEINCTNGAFGLSPVICMCPVFYWNQGFGAPHSQNNGLATECFDREQRRFTTGICETDGVPLQEVNGSRGEDGKQGGVFLRVCGDETEEGDRKTIVIRIKSLGKGGVETFDARKRPDNSFNIGPGLSSFLSINRAKTIFPTRDDRRTEVEVYLDNGSGSLGQNDILLSIKADGGRAHRMTLGASPNRDCASLSETFCKQCGNVYSVGDDAWAQDCVGFYDTDDVVGPLITDEIYQNNENPADPVGGEPPAFTVDPGPAFDSDKYEYFEYEIDREGDQQIAFPLKLQDPDIDIKTISDWYANAGGLTPYSKDTVALRMAGTVESPVYDVSLDETIDPVSIEEYTMHGGVKYIIEQDTFPEPMWLWDFNGVEEGTNSASQGGAIYGFSAVSGGGGNVGAPDFGGSICASTSVKYFLDDTQVVDEFAYFEGFDDAVKRRIEYTATDQILGNFIRSIFVTDVLDLDGIPQIQGSTKYLPFERSVSETLVSPGKGGYWNALLQSNGIVPPMSDFQEGIGGNGGAVYFGMGDKINLAALSDYDGVPPDEDEEEQEGTGLGGGPAGGDEVPPADPSEIKNLISKDGFKFGDAAGSLEDGSTPPMDPVNIYSDNPVEDPYSYIDDDGVRRHIGENTVAIGRFTKIPYVARNGDFYITVSAEHIRGIKEVQFSLNGSPWEDCVVTEKQGYPANLPEARTIGTGVYDEDFQSEIKSKYTQEAGYPEYIARVDYNVAKAFLLSSDTDLKYGEIRARIIPNVGIPLILQGHDLDQYEDLRTQECGICRYGRYVQERDPAATDPFATYEVFKPYLHKRRYGTDYPLSPWYDIITNYDGTENMNAFSWPNSDDGSFDGYTPQELSDYRNNFIASYDTVPGGITYGYYPQDYDPRLNVQEANDWLYIDKADCPEGFSGIFDASETEIYFEDFPEGEDVYVKGQTGEILRWDVDDTAVGFDTKFLKPGEWSNGNFSEASDSLLFDPSMPSNRNTGELFRGGEIVDRVMDGLSSFIFNVQGYFTNSNPLVLHVDSKYGDNDSGDGTYEFPYRTIEKVIDEHSISLRTRGGTIILKGTKDDIRTYRSVGDSGPGSGDDPGLEPQAPFNTQINLGGDKFNKSIVLEAEEYGGVIIRPSRQGLDQNDEGTFLTTRGFTNVVVKNAIIYLQNTQKFIAPIVVAMNEQGLPARKDEKIVDFKHTNEMFWDNAYSGQYNFVTTSNSYRVFGGSDENSVTILDCLVTPDMESPEFDGMYWSNYDWRNPGDYIVTPPLNANGDARSDAYSRFTIKKPPGSEEGTSPADPNITKAHGPIKVPFPQEGDHMYFGAVLDIENFWNTEEDAGFDDQGNPLPQTVLTGEGTEEGEGPRGQAAQAAGAVFMSEAVDLRAILLKEQHPDVPLGVETAQGGDFSLPYPDTQPGNPDISYTSVADWPGVRVERSFNDGHAWARGQAWRWPGWQRFNTVGVFELGFISYNCAMKSPGKGPDQVYMSKHDFYDRLHWDQFSSNPGSVFHLHTEKHDTSGDFTTLHGDLLQTFDFSGNPLTRKAEQNNRMFNDIFMANSKFQVANFEGNKQELPNMGEWRNWEGNPYKKETRAPYLGGDSVTFPGGVPVNPLEVTGLSVIGSQKGNGINTFDDVFNNWSFSRWIIDNSNNRIGSINFGCWLHHFVFEDIIIRGCEPAFAAMGGDWAAGRNDYQPLKSILFRNQIVYQFKGIGDIKSSWPNELVGNTVDKLLNRLQYTPYPTHATPFQDLFPDVVNDAGSYRRVGMVASDGTDFICDRNQIIENLYTYKPNMPQSIVSDQDLEYWRPALLQEATTYRDPNGQMRELPGSYFDLNTNSGPDFIPPSGEPSPQPTKGNPEYSHYCDTLASHEGQLFEGATGPWGVTEDDVLANVDVGPNGTPPPGGVGFPSNGPFYWGGGFAEYAWRSPFNNGYDYGLWGKLTGFRGVCCRRLLDPDDVDNDGNTFEFIESPDLPHWGPFDSSFFTNWTCKSMYYYDSDQLDLRQRNRSRITEEYPHGMPLLDNYPRGNNVVDWSERP